MRDPLESLIDALKRERCPGSVRDRVARRVDSATPPASVRSPRWAPRLAWGVLGVILALVLGLDSLRNRPSRAPDPGIGRATVPSSADRAAVVEQTQVALAIVGRVLGDAGVRTGDALMKEAVPPLIDGFLSAKQKLTPSL